MAWHQFSVQVEQTRIEHVEDLLLATGALTVTLRDADDQPLLEPKPGEMPLWDQSIVVCLFDVDTDRLLIEAAISNELSNTEQSSLHYELVADRDWVRAWMDDFHPMPFGDTLWVVPSHREPIDNNAVNMVLDPGLAFGTGTHPTTAMCLRWLDQQDLHAQTLLDFGCGSGILAIAGLLLGANRAFVTDIDPQAIEATHSNAQQNHVDDRITVLATGENPNQPIDVLLANILAGPLLELAPVFAKLCPSSSKLALSGILREQANGIIECYAQWFELEKPSVDGDWALVTGTRK